MHSPKVVSVSELSQILILPLRLECHGEMLKKRANVHLRSREWLSSAAQWISDNSSGDWVRTRNLYETLGFFADSTSSSRHSEADSYALAVYFHPFIRDMLFDNAHKPVEVLEHSRVRYVEITASRSSALPYPPRLFRITRLHLFLFPSDIAILSIQLDWEIAPGQESLSLAETQDLLNQFRRLYAPYFYNSNGHKPGEVPYRVRWLRDSLPTSGWGSESDYSSDVVFEYVRNHRVPPVTAHWQSILNPLHQEESPGREITIGQVVDERAPSMVFLAVEPVRNIHESDIARLLFLDCSGPAGEYSYSPEFLGRMKKYRYDRFWSPEPPQNHTTRFLCCGYNFLLVASRDDAFTPFLRKHFEGHYFFLGLLAWMQKASLLAFWHRLAKIVHTYSNEKASAASRKLFFNDAKWLLEDVSDFVARFHFAEVSNQLQALELFQWWSRRLGIPSLYSQVIEQTKFLREVQFNHWQEESQNTANGLQTVALYWLPISVALSFLSFFGLTVIDALFRGVERIPGFEAPVTLLLQRGVLAFVAVLIVLWILLLLTHAIRSRRKSKYAIFPGRSRLTSALRIR